MVLGYPGRTSRYLTAYEVANTFTWTYPNAKAYREKIIDIIHAQSSVGSDDAFIQLAVSSFQERKLIEWFYSR